MLSSIAFGLFGLAILISIAYAFSTHKRSVDWRQVVAGVGLQIHFAILIFASLMAVLYHIGLMQKIVQGMACQLGGIGGIALGRRSDITRLGLRAAFGGTLATMMTATIAGILTSLAG